MRTPGLTGRKGVLEDNAYAERYPRDLPPAA
jgi:hypothetical protein